MQTFRHCVCADTFSYGGKDLRLYREETSLARVDCAKNTPRKYLTTTGRANVFRLTSDGGGKYLTLHLQLETFRSFFTAISVLWPNR